jgi:hypothetical protein
MDRRNGADTVKDCQNGRLDATQIIWVAVELCRNDNISVYCADSLNTVWNRGIGMVMWNWGPWRQVEVISRAVSSITANGLGFQQTHGVD